MEISSHVVTTGMGKGHSILKFLSDVEVKNLDSIGYSGKNLKSEKINRQRYLNTLGKGQFQVEQTKIDTGDFSEKFLITRVQ